MLRYLRAMAWLRWRVMLNTARPSRRRDVLEQLSRLGAVLTPILLTLLLVPSALVMGIAGYIGGRTMAGDPFQITLVTSIARVLLALSFAAVLLAPLVRTIQGAHVGLQRLMLLPIPRRMLHLSEYVSGLTDPWVAVFVPGIVMLPVGLLAGGAVTAAALAGVAAIVVLAALAGVGSLCSFAALLVFRNRRRAELVTLVVFLVLSTIGFVPALLDQVVFNPDRVVVVESADENGGETGGDDETAAESSAGPVEDDEDEDERSRAAFRAAFDRIERAFVWVRWVPSELFGVGLARAAGGRFGSAALHVLGLILVAGLLYGFSERLYRRLIETPESGSGPGAGSAEVRSLHLPGVRPTTAAIALTVLRTALRTVRGKMAVFFTPAVVAFLWFVLGRELAEKRPDVAIGPFLLLGGAALAFLSLQPVLHNQFAVDGSGLTLQFLVPVSVREIAAGKVVGNGLLALLTTGLCGALALVLSRQGHPVYWLSMVLCCAAGFVVLAPLCTLLSAVLPKTADLSRMGKAGNPHPIAGLVGALLTVVTLLPPLGLFALGMFLAQSPWLTLLLTGGWLVVSVVVALPLVRAAGVTVSNRRENLLLVAGGR
jgi:hypothetical protein